MPLLTLIALVVANMIGAGVFTTSGFALADLGSPDRVMLAWVIGGFIAICGAVSYGALARHLTESGGEYLFLSRFAHPMLGFVAGCVSLLAGFTGAIAVAALAFEAYVAPIADERIPAGFIASLLVLVAALFHGIRAVLGTAFQNGIVGLKIILILIFLGYAAQAWMTSHLPADYSARTPFSILDLTGSLVWISLSYSGYNATIYVAGETDRRRNIVGRSMWIGTIVVTLLYLLLNAAFVYLVPFEKAAGKQDIAAVAAQHIGGEFLVFMVRGIISLALVTSVFSMVMIGPRVYSRMADDGLFPKIFRTDSDLPRWSIAAQALGAITLIYLTGLKDLLSYLGLTLSLCAALTVSCLFFLERREFLLRTATLIPAAIFVLATIVFAVLSAVRRPIELIAAILTFAGSGAVYIVISRLRSETKVI